MQPPFLIVADSISTPISNNFLVTGASLFIGLGDTIFMSLLSAGFVLLFGTVIDTKAS